MLSIFGLAISMFLSPIGIYKSSRRCYFCSFWMFCGSLGHIGYGVFIGIPSFFWNWNGVGMKPLALFSVHESFNARRYAICLSSSANLGFCLSLIIDCTRTACESSGENTIDFGYIYICLYGERSTEYGSQSSCGWFTASAIS